jgi:PIN domain nuclease of toxin-antitoxin system
MRACRAADRDVAVESERLPESFANDPADRSIAATARLHDFPLVTADAAIRGHLEIGTLG